MIVIKYLYKDWVQCLIRAIKKLCNYFGIFVKTWKQTFVIADIPEAASPYPILDITLPTGSGTFLFLQKTLSIASNSDLSASGTAVYKNNLKFFMEFNVHGTILGRASLVVTHSMFKRNINDQKLLGFHSYQ